MRRALILFLLAAPTIAAPTLELGQKLARFHQHYDRFMRAFFGCPKGAVSIDECSPNQGTIDYGEFNRAARDAEPLFGLERKKE